MQAIILAAGMGRRLGELTRNNTKCMVRVNGVALIDRLLNQLVPLNLRRVVIVVGYEGQKLRDYIGTRYDDRLHIEYVNNPVYDKTNNIYSLALAKEQLQEDDTLLIESDLIFDAAMFDLILSNPCPNLALVAKYQTWMDGTMVCIDDDNNIVNFVPKKAFNYQETHRYYKTVNIYKFSREFARHKYVPFLEAYSKALGNNEYYEQVLRVITFLDKSELKALPITTEKWYEIDDIQDLDIATTLFAEDDEQLRLYMRRYGGYWRFPDMLDYCYLVNPYFPSERMRDEMRANFDTLLTEYPSGMYVNALLAGKCWGIRQEYVVPGNGAAELIKSIMVTPRGVWASPVRRLRSIPTAASRTASRCSARTGPTSPIRPTTSWPSSPSIPSIRSSSSTPTTPRATSSLSPTSAVWRSGAPSAVCASSWTNRSSISATATPRTPCCATTCSKPIPRWWS